MKTGRVEFLGRNNVIKRNWLSFVFACMILSAGIIAIIPSMIDADGGWVPYFDDFSIYEPGQKAIIAWDGEEEILILSVDVYGAGSNKALHMVPLPNMPTLKLGNISAFETINNIIFNRGYLSDGGYGEGEAEGEAENEGKGVKIEFHERIGPHNLTVVSVKSSTEFIDWVKNFLMGEGIENITFPEGILDVIDHYLHENINYFAFDVIDINKTKYSIQPIIYKFKSDFLFYPLVISSLIEGSSEINVVTLTPADLPIDTSDFSELGFSRHFGFKVSHAELETISPTIADLITTDAYLSFYRDLFLLNDLKIDVKSKEMSNVNWFESVYEEIKDPIYFDCNGDNFEDVIFYSEGMVGQIYYEATRSRSPLNLLEEPYIAALNSLDGSLLWKLNFTQANNTTYVWLNLVGMELVDVNSDGKLELLISFGTRTRYYHDYWDYFEEYGFTLIALDVSTGDQMWSFILPQDNYYFYDYYFNLPQKIGDIDSDGKLEIIFYTGGSEWTKLHVVNLNDGTLLWNYTLSEHGWEGILDFIIFDITQDLALEVIVRTEERIFVLDGKTGKNMWSKEVYYNEYSQSLNYALLESIHDFDLDGDLEIFIVSSDESLYLLNGTTGTLIWSQDLSNSRAEMYSGWTGGSSVGFYDVDSDGILEIFYFWLDGVITMESNNGTILWQNLAIAPQGEPYYDWYYYYYYYLDDYWQFDFCNLDNDDRPEIIYYYGQYIYALNSDTGSIKWYRKLDTQYDYSIIFDLNICNINNNDILEIIVSIEDILYVLNGQDGSILWKTKYYEDLPINYVLIDTNSDSTPEILVECANSIILLNVESGNVEWSFYKRTLKEITYFELIDFDGDSDLELLLADRNGLYVLNPLTGNLIWNFIMGDGLKEYHYNSVIASHSKNLLILSDDRIYSVNKQQMHCALNVNPASARVGEEVTVRMYLGYFDTPISGAEIKTSDYGKGGLFSNIDELYPGVYQFNYQIPETTGSTINISLDAYHSRHYGVAEVIQIEIKDNASESAENEENSNQADKNLLSIYASAVPDTLKPGETSTIIFKVTSSRFVLVSDLNITLFDSFMNGSFSAVERYYSSSEYLTFSYTVDKLCSAKSIPIIILASYENYHEGICIINLNITIDDSEINTEPPSEPESPEENLTIDKLSVIITAYPKFIMPDSEAAIMVYITSGEYDISNAQFQIFDNSLGGTWSNVMDHGGGYYSFIYTLPATVPERVSNAIIFLYISHDDYFSQLEFLELPIIREEPEQDPIQPGDLELQLIANPSKIQPGEHTSIVISILDEATILPSIDTSKLKVELGDHDKGGTFSLVENHDLERIVYNYESSKLIDSTIEITVILYYSDLEISSEKLILEVVPVQAENEDTSDSDKDSGNIDDSLLIILPLLIFIIVFVISFGLMSRIKPKAKKK